MHVTKNHIDDHSVDVEIQLDKEELQEYILAAKSALVEGLTVEGFRKGKAPAHIAEKELSEQAVRSEALERALEGSFTKAVQEQQWDVARTDDLKVEQNDAEGLKYHVRVHLWPAVILPELATVRVDRKAVVVSDAEIQEALDTVRNMRATFLDKEGPAAIGDRVEIDFDASLHNVPIEGGSSRNHALIIGGKEFMPGFEDHLVGLRPEMTAEFTITAPADYHETQLAGKEIQFKVTLHRVQSVLKPAVDDTFAKSVGHFDTVQQLESSIRSGITAEKTTKEQQRVRLAILDAIIAHGTVPAPVDLVTEELHHMVHRFGDDLRERGTELSMYLARLKKTEADLESEWRPEAERQVRIQLVLREIAKQQHIQVAPEELEQAAQELLASYVRSGQIGDVQQIDQERLRSTIADRMLRDKVLGFLELSCAVDVASE